MATTKEMLNAYGKAAMARYEALDALLGIHSYSDILNTLADIAGDNGDDDIKLALQAAESAIIAFDKIRGGK